MIQKGTFLPTRVNIVQRCLFSSHSNICLKVKHMLLHQMNKLEDMFEPITMLLVKLHFDIHFIDFVLDLYLFILFVLQRTIEPLQTFDATQRKEHFYTL